MKTAVLLAFLIPMSLSCTTHGGTASRRILALGDSHKTEVAWYESTLRDAKDDRMVARLLMMTRLLKGSSPLWA